jgi:GTP-binding protein HflX
VESQGDRVVAAEVHELHRPDPRTLIRSGVAARIGSQARDLGADLLVIDAELSPSQTRNLEDATGLRVADREAVILNVFERHATTPRARAQVELAHLEYLRPRIRGIGLDMDQQAGGVMGSRGSGDTASELLARNLDDRLVELRRRLEQISRTDAERRRRRTRAFRVALAGYTNAGKTSLMNALCDAGLSARDRPFETLDTTTRCLTRHGGDVLLSDTVGFIRRLPDRLFASFQSTMAEISEPLCCWWWSTRPTPSWTSTYASSRRCSGVWGRRRFPGWSSSTRSTGWRRFPPPQIWLDWRGITSTCA